VSHPADPGRTWPVTSLPDSDPLTVLITGEDWLDPLCPLLRARDGSWRSASPMREHRCWATDPPSEPPVMTQQRLCLVRAHDGCERFLHARELRSAALAREHTDRGDFILLRLRPGGARVRRVPSRSAQLGERIAALRDAIADRTQEVPRAAWVAGGVAAVILVLVVAFAVGGGGGRHGAGTLPGVSGPSVDGSGSPGDVTDVIGPDGLRRYRIVEGDTLRSISDRYGVSVRDLRAVNDLGDPPRLVPGEEIVIPASG
jgi:hypothetical protein